MGPRGLPVPNRGQEPALRLVGEPADKHAQQPGPLAGSDRRPLQAQLDQQRAALQAGTPAGEVEGDIQGFPLIEGPGEGIVAPGGEVGPGGGEMQSKMTHHRSDRGSQFHRSGLVGRIHAVSPEQKANVSET